MSSPHMNPAANGIRFGEVVVTVDIDLRDAVIRAPGPSAKGPARSGSTASTRSPGLMPR